MAHRIEIKNLSQKRLILGTLVVHPRKSWTGTLDIIQGDNTILYSISEHVLSGDILVYLDGNLIDSTQVSDMQHRWWMVPSVESGIVGFYNVETKSLSSPPSVKPEIGSLYIVKSPGEGPWTGCDNQIAEFIGTGYVCKIPVNREVSFVKDILEFWWYDSSVGSWKLLSGGGGGTTGRWWPRRCPRRSQRSRCPPQW